MMNKSKELNAIYIAIKNGKLCCLCCTPIVGYGNNPYPVEKEEGVKCCDACNAMYVIPARLRQLGIG